MTRIFICLLALSACHHGHSHDQPSSESSPVVEAPLTEAAIAVPIAPGKTDAWKAALADLLGPRYAEYAASRQRYGLTSQTTFVQRTPMGDFAVIHMTGPDVHASFHAMSTSQDPWDQKWRELTLNLHGMDFAQGERVTPKVEPAFSMDSGDSTHGTKQFMFLAPLSADGVAQFRQLSSELMGPKHADYVRARNAAGIRREAVFLETSQLGMAAVFYWLADDPVASLDRIAHSTDPFDVALRDQVAKMHPIGLDAITSIASQNELVAQFPH
ncbi:MAG: hypothetical protein QM831_11480 [Kofleriaceae bacterium]